MKTKKMKIRRKVVTQADPLILENIEDIEIPDLWQLAMALGNGYDNTGICDRYRRAERSDVLKVWHIAHHLKNHILELENDEQRLKLGKGI